MGCVKSKQDKGAATKYHTDSTPVSDANAAAAKPHAGHYGPEPTQLLQNHPGSAAPGAANFNHSLTPFGGSSSVMTPFGGMSCSFSGPVSNSFSGAVSSELSRYIESGGCGVDSRCGCFVCRPPTERRLTCESKNIGRFLSWGQSVEMTDGCSCVLRWSHVLRGLVRLWSQNVRWPDL